MQTMQFIENISALDAYWLNNRTQRCIHFEGDFAFIIPHSFCKEDAALFMSGVIDGLLFQWCAIDQEEFDAMTFDTRWKIWCILEAADKTLTALDKVNGFLRLPTLHVNAMGVVIKR